MLNFNMVTEYNKAVHTLILDNDYNKTKRLFQQQFVLKHKPVWTEISQNIVGLSQNIIF